MNLEVQEAFELLCSHSKSSIQSAVLTFSNKYSECCAHDQQAAFRVLCSHSASNIQSAVLTFSKHHSDFYAHIQQVAFRVLYYYSTSNIQSAMLTFTSNIQSAVLTFSKHHSDFYAHIQQVAFRVLYYYSTSNIQSAMLTFKSSIQSAILTFKKQHSDCYAHIQQVAFRVLCSHSTSSIKIALLLSFSNAWLTTLIDSSYCWKSLQKRIPNGDHVPNPCNSGELWEGVGHLKPGGYGKRNSFGHDFQRYGKHWSRDFCMLDSDGDGRTNGEELGDPDCEWVAGSGTNASGINITHPGICEPLSSKHCKSRNKWLHCDDTGFKCDVTNDTVTKNFTINIPRMEVPVKETSHKCMVFDFPQDGDFHMVATTPKLDNKMVMHHILIFGCDENKKTKHDVNEVFDCELSFDPACTDILSLWLLGMDGECMHENMGFRIGTRGYKRGGIQVHWENQQYLPNLMDGSGMTIYYTDQLRMYDAGVLFIGQDHMIIPPGKKNHTEVGHCYPECSQRKWSEDVHVTFAINHMHYLGRSQKIEHLRNGKVINVITDEQDFDFDSPELHVFREPIVLKPSDEIRTTCVYDSTSRDVTTRAGSGYREEMCFGFLTYYPKQAISNGATICTSWKTIPHCRFELDDTVYGCNFKIARNMSHPATKEIFDKVMKHCRPFGPCFEDCRTVVKEITKLPCYHGDMWEWQRNKIGGPFDNKTETADWYRFYAAFDSCSSELNSNCGNRSENTTVANCGLNHLPGYIFLKFTLLTVLLALYTLT
ncbi:uncharacterized protein LOC123524569 [Mercenaria mercenaria]|uniref:uncharacterized protein LOC123524569 n=1 Tax=Mercenaria mercenaria TaxID=6596 RepID=UPI00234F89DE|nr:uncharacterized protein LOC123524569 [Mercenaria mercenaria]